jgi:hypothetical protein
VFVEQELQQSRQQLVMGTVRKQLSEIKVDAQKKLGDYQKEVENSDKDVEHAEQRLQKAKAMLEKLIDQRDRTQARNEGLSGHTASGSYDAVLGNTSSGGGGGGGGRVSPNHNSNGGSLVGAGGVFSQAVDRAAGQTYNPSLQAAAATTATTSSVSSGNSTYQEYQRGKTADKLKALQEAVAGAEIEVSDTVAALMRAITARDQVRAASRRAHQKLDRECKLAVKNTLTSLVQREKEGIQARIAALEKLESAVGNISVESDISEFISQHVEEEDTGPAKADGPLVLSSQALSIIDRLVQQKEEWFSAASTGPEAAAAQQRHTGGNSSSATGLRPPVKPDGPDDPIFKEIETHLEALFTAADNENSSNPTAGAASARRASLSVSDSIGGQSRLTDPAAVTSVSYGLIRLESTLSEDQLTPEGVGEYSYQFQLNASIEQKQQEYYVEKTVVKLGQVVTDQRGRDVFSTVLNRYRSKKCDVGLAFHALNGVLWQALTECGKHSDVHTAKVIMMLSQTFYRMHSLEEVQELQQQQEKKKKTSATAAARRRKSGDDYGDGNNDDGEDADNNDDGDMVVSEREIEGRGEGVRHYLKDRLMVHPIWKKGAFWEQVLWECAIEQLCTIPYTRRWFDMSASERSEAVARVHNVVMSQVMAVEHSMLELGCEHRLVRIMFYVLPSFSCLWRRCFSLIHLLLPACIL